MVAIVSGNGLGLGSSSLATLGQRGLFGASQQGRSSEQSFINIANGNLVLQGRDDYLAARGLDLASLRTYNSQGSFNDDNGDNWSSGIYGQQAKLTGTLNTPGSEIIRTDSGGAQTVYKWNAARNCYLNMDGAGAYDTLAAVGDSYVWTDGATGNKEFYDAASGRLSSVSDTSGNTLAYAYDASGRLASTTTASGDVTHFDYVGNNLSRIRTVTAAGAQITRVNYGYDGSDRLVSVVVDLSPEDNSTADGRVYQTTYTYDGASKRVASITQADGTSVSFTYVQMGSDYRIASVQDALGHLTTYGYDLANRRTTVTDPLGLVTAYEYDAAGQLTKITAPSIGGVSQVTTYSYNANGDLLQVIDPKGQATVMGYDANGNQVLQRDASGNTITRTFDANNQLQTETVYAVPDPDGDGASLPSGAQTTRYVYDATNKNLLRFVLSPSGRVTEYRYDGWGQQISSIQYAGLAYYNVAALGATDTVPEATVASWAAAQNRAFSMRTDRVLDARGQLQTLVRYAKVDASGNGVVDGTQSTTQYIYDQAGQLLKTVTAAGATDYVYDGMGRILSVQDALSQVTTTSYDDVGGKTSITFANGLTTTSAYDAAGRLIYVRQSSAQTLNLGTTQYFYDADNRLVMREDPTGVRAWVLYDEAGRKIADVDGDGSLVEYVYDANGLVTQSVRYANAVSLTSLVDVVGQPLNPTLTSVRPSAGASDQKTWFIYDASNRLVKSVSAEGAVTEMQYDGASRLVKTLHYANVMTAAALGALGSAPSSAEVSPIPSAAADRVTRQFYDGDGLLVATLDGEGYLTELQYDSSGRLLTRRAYFTATAPGLRDAGDLAQLRPAITSQDLVTRYIYNGKGQISAEIDALGYLTEKVYDANGNLSQSVRYATAISAGDTAVTTVPSVRPAANAQDRSTTFVYDSLNRLSQSVDPSGTITQYSYDSVGRLVKTVSAAGTSDVRTINARYDLQGRLTGELSGVGSALITGNQTQAQIDAIWAQYGLTHAYDAAGRRISTTDAYGNKTVFFYDVDGRLTHSVNALGEVQENQYNALGQLTATISYGTRVAAANLPGIGAGGLSSLALANAINGIKNAALDGKVSYSYTPAGDLASSTDALGNVTTFDYNAFGEESGRTRALGSGNTLVQSTSFDRRGLQVDKVLDPSGINAVTHAIYDAFGRLTGSVDANGRATTMTYDKLGRVVASLDPLNVTRGTTYDAFDRVLTQTDGLGKVTTYSYDKTARSIKITSPEGISITTVQTRRGQTQSVKDGLNNTTTYAYDADGNLLSTTTPLTTTSNTYDRSGRLASSTDANGNQVTFSYDAANRVLTRVVDPAGLNLVTSYAYDSSGRAITTTDPLGVVTQLNYDLKGQLISRAIDPAGLNLVTSYSYDATGKTLNVTDPSGTVTHYTYDKLGRRTLEQVDPNGLNLTRSYVYDKVGNVTGSVDGNGNCTRYAYDEGDRLVYTVDALGNLKQVSYDAEGRVTKTSAYAKPIDLTGLSAAPSVAEILAKVVVSPTLDKVESLVYDKDGRLKSTTNAMGGSVQLTYDAAGNVVMRSAYGIVTKMVYDQLGRAILTVDGCGGVVRQTYDGNGNVVDRIAYATAIPTGTASTLAAINAAVVPSSTDNRVRSTFDSAGRLLYRVDGIGAVTKFIYDQDGHLINQVAYASAVMGSAAPQTVIASAADRVTAYAYDKAGRQTYTLNALGGVVHLVYDAQGNVTQRVAYANPIAPPVAGTFLGEVDFLTVVVGSPSSDRIERFAYDAANRRIFSIDATGAVTEFMYDGAGNTVQSRQYAKLIDSSTLGVTASVASVRTLIVSDASKDRIEKRSYDAAQRLVFSVDALGYIKQNTYDGLGQIAKTTSYALAIPAGTVNATSSIAGAVVSNTSDRTDTFTYDAAGRLVTTTDSLGFVEKYSYNLLGQKIVFINKNGAVWRYAYDAAGRLVTETSPYVAATTVQVNATTGNLEWQDFYSFASEQVITTMAYDALGNLLSRTEATGLPEQRITNYVYDALGHQVQTIYPAVYVYDANGDNITANGAAGNATRVDVLQALGTRTIYDVFGNAVANYDLANTLSLKVYDKLGRVTYDVDGLGFVTRYARNSWGDVTALTRYSQGTNLLMGNPSGRSEAEVAAVVNAPGIDHGTDRVLLTEYDQQGRAVKVIEPSTFTYDPDAAAGGQYAIVGKTTQNTYNAFGELRRAAVLKNPTSNTWTATEYFYDQRGAQTATVDALGYLTTRSCDAAGNAVASTQFATAIASWNSANVHDLAPVATTHLDDRTTLSSFDLGNRKISETRVNVEYSTTAGGATSTRGNLTTSYAYDAVGNLTATTDANGAVTRSYYDAMGRVTAIAGPARIFTQGSSSYPLIAITEFRRDAYGNVVVKIEHNDSANWADANSYSVSSWVDRDHRTIASYDCFGHVTQITDAQGYNHFSSYDARGNIAKEWQTVTGNDNVARTLFHVYKYDALGRQTHVIDPASTTVYKNGLTAALTSPTLTTDASGFKMLAASPANSVSLGGLTSFVSSYSGLVRVQVDYETLSTYQVASVDSKGLRTYSGVQSHAATVTQDFAPAAVSSGLNVSWANASNYDGGISKLSHVRIWQQDYSGVWVLKWDGTAAQINGTGITTVTQQQAGTVDTALEYNAFGEVVRKGVDGGRQEYFDYDNAGRVWRTNSGDGVVKVALYDAQGHQTADIRSAGSGRGNVDLQLLNAPQDAAALAEVRRTDTRYDALGRVTQQLQPERLQTQGGVIARQTITSSSITSSAVVTSFDGAGTAIWSGTNSISFGWNSLAGLGSGDVKAVVDYTSQAHPTTGPVWAAGVAQSTSQIVTAEQGSSGITFSWLSGTSNTGGVASVNRLRLYKKDVQGNWQLVSDQTSFGAGPTSVEVPTPADASTNVQLQLRPAGTAGTGGWTNATLVNFGDVLRYNASALGLGSYEYQVLTTPAGGETKVTAKGTLGATEPDLAAISVEVKLDQPGMAKGVLAWASPGLGKTQVVRVRQWGGAWTTLTITKYANGYDGVNLSGLPSGSYDYELLWTDIGQSQPYAHAIGILVLYGQGATAGYVAVATTKANTPAISQKSPVLKLGLTTVSVNGDSTWSRPVINQKLDRWGNVLELNDPRSVNWKTTYSYNANNQMIRQSQTDADGNQSAASGVSYVYYGATGLQLATKDANGKINTQEVDSVGKVVKETHADGGVSSYMYDNFGNKFKSSGVSGYVDYTYDKLNRLVKTVGASQSMNSITAAMQQQNLGMLPTIQTYVWDQAGRKLSSTNANSETLRYTYDMAGNVVATQQPLGQIDKTAFDAEGHKIAEIDANGFIATWSYDYFGQTLAHVDLGGAYYSYSYDNARQLTFTANNRGLRHSYQYDAAGQLIQNQDYVNYVLNQTTTYAWDLAGHAVREKVVQAGVVYQDNHMAYDALGRLRWVDDGRAYVGMEYDKVGNRTRIQTHVINGDTSMDENRYFKYDAMNRQIVVDAVDAAGNLGAKGHAITYDTNGNRLSDTSQGMAEQYSYDQLNRLQIVKKNGVVTDARFYDGAGRLLISGYTGIGYVINRFDANGHLLAQRVLNGTTGVRYQTDYSSYDAAGNVLGYTLQNYEGGAYTNTYTYTLQRFETYKETKLAVTSTYFQPGSTTSAYDGNGFLISVTDATNAANNKTFVNDAGGKILSTTQNGQIQRQLIVAGEVLGRYGMQGGTSMADFNFSYQPINGNYPKASPGIYSVATGDTLRSIAQGAYGDSSLWYRIAEENGLQGDNDLRVGQTLSIPNRVGTVSNNSSSFVPYDPTKVVGDTTPYLASPPPRPQSQPSLPPYIVSPNGLLIPTDAKSDAELLAKWHELNNPSLYGAAPSSSGGCGGIGAILVVAIVVVATVFTAGLMAPAAATVGGATAGGTFAGTMAAGSAVLAGGSGLGAAVAAGAVGSAVGSIAGQVAGNAMGIQDGFSWRSVALSAISGGVGGGLSGLGLLGGQAGTLNAMGGAALGNALTQGIGVVTGLQEHFDWRGVAASAVGAGVGYGVGSALKGSAFAQGEMGSFASRALTGVAAGAATAVVRGGRVAIQQIATDAFGNALGSSLAYGGLSGQSDGSTSGDQEHIPLQPEMTTGSFAREDGSTYRSDAYVSPLTSPQQQAMAIGYGPLTPQAAVRALSMQSAQPGDIADGAATLDKMGQPLTGRSNYNAATQFGKIIAGVGNESVGTTAGKLLDWATYTVPDADQRAAEVRARYGNDPRFAQIDQMRDSPLGAIGWLGAKVSGASPAAQQMWLDIGTSADGLAMSMAAVGGRAAAYTGARTMPELVGEPKLFERYEATRVSVEREMFNTPKDELSVVISRDTGAELSRQLIPGTGGRLSLEMQSNMSRNSFTHYHPEGGNFSPSDILTGLAAGAAEIRAVMPGRTVSLNFEGAPAGLLGNPASAFEFMKDQGGPINAAVKLAVQAGNLPTPTTVEARVQASNFAIKNFVALNPWVKYTETQTKR